MAGPTRILILCCNRLLRESITRIVGKRNEFEIVGSQSVGTITADEILQLKADIVVCDSLRFFLRECRTLFGGERTKRAVKFFMVAMENSTECFMTAVRHGVAGYVLQEASAAEVLLAICSVAAGEAVCPQRFSKVLFDYVASQPADSNEFSLSAKSRLTRREQQLIPLIGRGLTNKEIANQLNVSEQTIKSHVHRILHKAGVKDRHSLLHSQFRYERVASSPTAFHF